MILQFLHVSCRNPYEELRESSGRLDEPHVRGAKIGVSPSFTK